LFTTEIIAQNLIYILIAQIVEAFAILF